MNEEFAEVCSTYAVANAAAEQRRTELEAMLEAMPPTPGLDAPMPAE